MHPPLLKSAVNNRIFTWTPELAKRPDMVGINKDGTTYIGPVDIPGEDTPEKLLNEGDDSPSKLRLALQESNQTIKRLQAQLNLMIEEIQAKQEKITNLEQKLYGARPEPPSSMRPEDPEEGADEDAPMEEQGHNLENEQFRAQILIDNIIQMIRNNDPNDFTGQGKPRIPRLQEMCGIGEIVASERDFAFDIARAQLEAEQDSS